MEQIFVNGLYYSIEFIKLLLAMVFIWRVKPKKSIGFVFVASLMFVMTISWFKDLSQISIVYAIINVIIITVFTSGKNRMMLSLLSFILISLVDMLFAEILFNVYFNDYSILIDNVYGVMLCNTVSLILLVVYAFVFGKKYVNSPRVTRILLPIYIIGGLTLTIFVTGIQIIGMDGDNKIQHNILFLGILLATVFAVAVCVLLEHDKKENEHLSSINEMNSRLMEAQSNYYLRLLQKEKETKAFRHDIRAQFMCMGMLYEKGDYEKLGTYIHEAQSVVLDLSSEIDTGNDYVNAIITDLDSRYPTVELEWKGRIPDIILSYMDICTVFYNLLKNAYEAAYEAEEKKIKAFIRIQQQSIFISVLNNYREIVLDNRNGFKTTKEGEGHGYGMENIRRCVEKYHGEYSVAVEQNIFKTDIMMLDVVKNEN